MVTKTSNHSDLQNLKNELKLEIWEEQRKLRHESNNKIQNDYYLIDKKMSEYNTDLKLTKLTLDNMLEQMERWFEDIKEEIRSMRSDFVTKSELEPIREKQKDHDAIIKRLAWGAFILLLSLIAGFIWISKYM